MTSRKLSDISPERQPNGADSQESARQVIEIAARNGTHFFEWTHRRLDGEEFPATVLLSKITIGDQVMYRGTVRDTTAEKEAQARLIEAQLNLSEMNAELQRALDRANKYAEELTQKSLALNFQAAHDSLTGLPNRNHFDESLTELISECGGRRSRKLVVLFIDLDRFKLVNDTLGHSVGDEVLKEVARRLRSCLRPRDALARISGDEFVAAFLITQNRAQVESVASRIIDSISRPIEVDGNRFVIGVTVGIAAYPSDGDNAATLFRHADAAMYAAKKSANGTFRWYSGEIDSRNQSRLQIEQDIRLAMDKGQLRVYYQPIVGIDDESSIAVEALLRWEHPEKGMVSPGLFIPVAEQTGEIVRMGEYVLRTACGQLMSWREQGLSISRIGVNVSVAQFKSPEMWMSSVRQVLADTGLDPGSLELEITESDFAGVVGPMVSVLQEAGRLGIRIAIDDFGVGQSSLGRLKELPVVHLKIDGSFVREVGYNDRDISIIRHIIRMAHERGLEVTAEWVETDMQLNTLRDCGCDFAQGYAISAPLPVDEFLKFAVSRARRLRRAA